MKPTFNSQFIGIASSGVIKSKIIFHMAIHAHMPAITGCLRIVQHQTTCSTLATSFLELIEPPAIVGHVSSAEECIVIKTRVVDHSYHNLALHINACIVVPSILWRMNTKATEHILCLRQFDPICSSCRPYHKVVWITKFCFSLTSDSKLTTLWLGRDSYHLKGLEPTAIEGWLQAQLFQLASQIVHRLFLVSCHRLSSSELVGSNGINPFSKELFIIFTHRPFCSGQFIYGRSQIFSIFLTSLKPGKSCRSHQPSCIYITLPMIIGYDTTLPPFIPESHECVLPFGIQLRQYQCHAPATRSVA